MRRMAPLLTQVNKPIVGYNNVTYEESTYVPDEYGYTYFVPVNGVHFSMHFTDFGSVGILIFPPYEMYNYVVRSGWNLPVGWYGSGVNPQPFNGFNNSDVDFAYAAGNEGWPFGNAWGRYYGVTVPAHYVWASVGNLGYKTVAEYNALLATMDNTTKRNLIGQRAY